MPREPSPLNQLWKAQKNSQKLKQQTQALHETCQIFGLRIFMGLLRVRISESLTILPAPETLFLLLGCHVQCQYHSFVSSYTLFCHVWCCFLEAYSIQMRNIMKGSRGRIRCGESERIREDRGTIFSIFCIREIIHFQLKGNKKRKNVFQVMVI